MKNILEDRETSCKYLVISKKGSGYEGYGTAVTPLLKSEGTFDCD